MATLTKDLQKLSVANASSSSSNASSSNAWAESQDKVMTRALTTYQLLLKLGFTSAQAEDALANAATPDVEECLSHLYQSLDEESLEDAIRAGEGKAAKKRRGKDTTGAADDKADDGEDEEYDDSRPPLDAGYEFHRSEALGKNDFARSEQAPSGKIVPGAALPSDATSKSLPAASAKPATAATTAKVDPEKLAALKKACERLVLQLSDDLESDQIDTLEKPTATWSLLRAMQIRIDQEKSKWKKELGKDGDVHMKQEEPGSNASSAAQRTLCASANEAPTSTKRPPQTASARCSGSARRSRSSSRPPRSRRNRNVSSGAARSRLPPVSSLPAPQRMQLQNLALTSQRPPRPQTRKTRRRSQTRKTRTSKRTTPNPRPVPTTRAASLATYSTRVRSKTRTPTRGSSSPCVICRHEPRAEVAARRLALCCPMHSSVPTPTRPTNSLPSHLAVVFIAAN